MNARADRRSVRVTIDGEAYSPAKGVLIVVRQDGGKVCLPAEVHDVVQETGGRVWRRVELSDGRHQWTNGFLAFRSDSTVSARVARGEDRVLRYQAGESE